MGSPSLAVSTVSVDVRATLSLNLTLQSLPNHSDLCGSRCGRPGLLVPNSPYGFYGRKATLNSNLAWHFRAREYYWEKAQPHILRAREYYWEKAQPHILRARELCVKVEVDVLGSRPPRVSVDVSATLNLNLTLQSLPNHSDLCESRGGPPGLPVPNSLYGLYGRRATVDVTLNSKRELSSGAV